MIEVSKKYPDKPLSYNELQKLISELPDERLITICKEVYDWKNGTGVYSGVELEELAKETATKNRRDLADYAIHEALKRYKKVASLLFAENPTMLLRRFEQEEKTDE